MILAHNFLFITFFLKIGVTLASFHISVYIEVDNIVVKIGVTLTRVTLTSFHISVYIEVDNIVVKIGVTLTSFHISVYIEVDNIVVKIGVTLTSFHISVYIEVDKIVVKFIWRSRMTDSSHKSNISPEIPPGPVVLLKYISRISEIISWFSITAWNVIMGNTLIIIIIIGWSATTRLMYDGFLCCSKFVGSEISWDRPSLVKSYSISVSSGVVCRNLATKTASVY